MKKKEFIVVFSAHSDDFVLGAGGTIAKYVQEGKKVTAVIFSQGEKSHPWLKAGVVKKVRCKEAVEAAKLLGCKTVIFDHHDSKVAEDYIRLGTEQQLLRWLEKEKPVKLFTHSGEDIHPDHKAVYRITLDVVERIKTRPEVYIYSVWNPAPLETMYPTFYVPIRTYFGMKLQALRIFRSQQIHISYPVLLLIIRNVWDGIRKGTTFAEKFYRIK